MKKKLVEQAEESYEELVTDNQEESQVERSEISLTEFKEIDWFLFRNVGTFSGIKPAMWKNFVGLFERAITNKGWNRLNEEVLVELLTSRFGETARSVWEEWIQEDPEVMGDYVLVKEKFQLRFEGNIDPWKRLVDFHNLQMTGGNIVDYTTLYEAKAAEVDAEGCAVAKFYFSLPPRIREVINRGTGGEWPRTLGEMIKFAREMVLREESVNGPLVFSVAAVKPARDFSTITCFICNEKEHIVAKCPQRKAEKTTVDEVSNSSNKINYIKKIHYIPGFMSTYV